MTTINVQTTTTLVSAAKVRHFIHVQNDSDTDIFLQYDGQPDTLSAVNGFRLQPGAVLMLEERMADASPRAFNFVVNAIHAGTGSKVLRIQESF